MSDEELPQSSQNQKASDLFGELLMSRVRDTQIQFWDQTLVGETRHANYQQVYEALSQSIDAQQLASIRDLIPYVVDNVIAHFLGMLEARKEIDIAVHLEGQTVPNLRKVTEGLESALYGEDGWIAKFSKERYDPFGLEAGW